MKTQIITLKITVLDDYDYPDNWNWSQLLDLNHSIGERCEMLDYEHVLDKAEHTSS